MNSVVVLVFLKLQPLLAIVFEYRECGWSPIQMMEYLEVILAEPNFSEFGKYAQALVWVCAGSGPLGGR